MSVHLGYFNVLDEPIGDGVLTVEILQRALDNLHRLGRPQHGIDYIDPVLLDKMCREASLLPLVPEPPAYLPPNRRERRMRRRR